ncbi:FAD-binding protein [Amycolatopsis sp. GM8]|uniref:FAD-dependent oxidoreductase n=1 Tax=Amycolatopsis sp. GM8 TaxID=2896530 RepID=UPI001F3C99F9|nr:FAD-binding protein [Amycolatopsis sp. GM8]
MPEKATPNRRRVLVAGAAALAAAGSTRPAMAAPVLLNRAAPAIRGVRTISPGAAEYSGLIRGINQRWVGNHVEAIYLPEDTGQVAQVVKALVDAGKRFTVRAGGHCYENHVYNDAVRAVVDVAPLTQVDHLQGGIIVGAGTSLGEFYRTAQQRWGITLPGGVCGTVAAGGHIQGGGYGLLSRKYGLTVDHLHGVELVLADGSVRFVTRDSGGDDGKLFWAHTGGGGGNFGVVTRYLLRTPGVDEYAPPERMLPKAPGQVFLHILTINWSQLGATENAAKAKLASILAEYSKWCVAHKNKTGDGTENLFTQLSLRPRLSASALALRIQTQVAIDTPDDTAAARHVLKEFLRQVVPGYENQADTAKPMSWLSATQQLGEGGTSRRKHKSAYHRWLSGSQICGLVDTFWAAGTGADGAQAVLSTYGANVNRVSRDATAEPHRDSALKLQYLMYWSDPADDDRHLSWIRHAYGTVYRDEGGLPAAANRDVSGTSTDGCFVNYLDDDLPGESSDPKYWGLMYYGKDTLTKLRAVKAKADPHNVFRSNQSIPAA